MRSATTPYLPTSSLNFSRRKNGQSSNDKPHQTRAGGLASTLDSLHPSGIESGHRMTRPRPEIPELLGLEGGSGLVRIPTEQDVPFTPRVQALVDSVEFRRLGQISQLGLVSRVYPGAMHTRFEH